MRMEKLHDFWGGKRYHSLDYYLKQTYGRKIYKVSLNAGLSCPNRDGTLGSRGCIFCSPSGSGDFAAPASEPITKQIDSAIEGIRRSKGSRKGMPIERFIAYFQAFTNTYGPLSYLRRIFTGAINHPSIMILSIATRPDCLDEDVLSLLSELNQIKPVWIELGLQTSNEETAVFIRRGYGLSVFENAVARLNQTNISCIVHVILGLPFETREEMRNTIEYTASLPLQGIKIQLLHVLKDTDLAGYLGKFSILSMEEYVNLVVESLELLPPELVVHRITGDGPSDLLLAPLWSRSKLVVMNRIHQQLRQLNTWQGRLYKNNRNL